MRPDLEVSILHDRNPISVRLSDGSVRNSYSIKVRNMEARPREVELRLQGVDAVIWTEGGSRQAAGRTIRLTVPADQVAKVPLFVAASGDGETHVPISIVARALDREGGVATTPGFFERPE
jgi:polyferredoxin